jgi:REP element-mobilizing transposase RayT
MSRAWRIEYGGALYHLLSRGNEGGDIFFDGKDRKLFLYTLEELSLRFEVDVFCYVLMSNHYHLLLRTRRACLKKAMHWFGTTYTQRFNRRHFRSGHLFQGRYRSIIAENDACLLQLSYYIHHNPLRAGSVKRLADYRWSSYRIYAYGGKAPKWLSTDLILSQLEGEKDRHKSYREKIQIYAQEDEHLFENLRHGLILSSNQFVKKIREKYLPDRINPAVPQQKLLSTPVDLKSYLVKAEREFNCNVKDFIKAARLSGVDKEKRDLCFI